MKITHPQVVIVRLQVHSYWHRLKVADIQVPPRCHILGIVRQDRVLLVRANLRLYEGDFLIATALYGGAKPALKHCLERKQAIVWRNSHPQYLRQL
jgi:Trk K+ transport system NAD-binding subunit